MSVDCTEVEGPICSRQLAQLNELMLFLPYARLPDSTFHGIVAFSFKDPMSEQVLCIRTIECSDKKVLVHKKHLQRESVTFVSLSIYDFLYMYSGEATAAEIAGMCMSGRVEVNWRSYTNLRNFADSFDFSPEKWESYYAFSGLSPLDPLEWKCPISCCCQQKLEDIGANWNLVIDSVFKEAGEWELIDGEDIFLESSEAEVSSKQEQHTSRTILSFPLWCDKMMKATASNPHFMEVQETMKKKMINMKEYAEKLLVEQ